MADSPGDGGGTGSDSGSSVATADAPTRQSSDQPSPAIDSSDGQERGDARPPSRPPDSNNGRKPETREPAQPVRPDLGRKIDLPPKSVKDASVQPQVWRQGEVVQPRTEQGPLSSELPGESPAGEAPEVEAARIDVQDALDQGARVQEARDEVDAALNRAEADGLAPNTREQFEAEFQEKMDEAPTNQDAKQVEFQEPGPAKQVEFEAPPHPEGVNVPESHATDHRVELANGDTQTDRTPEAAGTQSSADNTGDRTSVAAREAGGAAADRHDLRTEGEFRAEYPDQYLEPMNRVSEEVEPFSAPEKLAERVNPDFETDEAYQNNCADCARSFERGWRGHVEEAAGRAYEVGTPDHPGLFVDGEPSQMTEDWAGRPMETVDTPSDLRSALEEGGHGSSAVVHSRWENEDGDSFGHAYNVVNDHGTIKTVDSQTHEVFEFDDSSIRPGIASDGQHTVLAWDSEGRVLNV